MCSTACFKSLTVVLALLISLPFPTGVAIAQAPTGLSLSVVPLGSGIAATSKTERSFSVQVQDVSTGPVVGAEVIFSVPQAAAGSFADGAKQVSVFSNLQGTALTPAFKFSNGKPIVVHVQASFRSQSATATLMCCSVEFRRSKARRNTILGILIGAGAGTAIYYSTRGGSVPPAVIRPGTPTIGVPN
jgi:hypothetical protein